ncbi:hypothetical protein JW978_00095 [Candidatus Dojkabacteria bacterium]|nr:hypothetical protein [Candidatus Dojkabacteria bacterium]
MRTILKVSLGIIFSILIGTYFVVEIAAEEKGEDVGLSIVQIVQLSDSSSYIDYRFTLQNNYKSEFLQNFEFSPGLEGFSIVNSTGKGIPIVDGQKIVVDFAQAPIAPGDEVEFSFKLSAPSLIKQNDSYKSIEIPRLDTEIQIEQFQRLIKYPQNWAEPVYKSAEFNENENLYVLWGDFTYLSFFAKFQVKADQNEKYFPFFIIDDRQQIKLESYTGLNRIYFDESGNSFFLLDDTAEIVFKGKLILDIRNIEKSRAFEKEPESFGINVSFKSKKESFDEKVLDILEFLKQNYEFQEHQNVQSLKSSPLIGDNRNLCAVFSDILNKNNLKARVVLGLNLMDSASDELSPVCWVEIADGDQIVGIDPNNFIVKDMAVYRTINTDRIKIINIDSSDSLKILDLDMPKYQIANIAEFLLGIDEEANISINPGSLNCEEKNLIVNIENNSDQILKIDSDRGLTEGVLPGKSAEYEFAKKEYLEGFDLVYSIGNEKFSKDMRVDNLERCSILIDMGNELSVFGLIAFTVFLMSLVISKLYSRPRKRIVL